MRYWYIFCDFFKYLPREIKYLYQKLTKGFSDKDTWNLDCTFVEFILPRIKSFKKLTHGYPANMNSMDEWQVILQEIIDGLELYKEWDGFAISDEDKAKYKKIRKSLYLLKKHWFNLWW